MLNKEHPWDTMILQMQSIKVHNQIEVKYTHLNCCVLSNNGSSITSIGKTINPTCKATKTQVMSFET
jgi:hypothetical protein